MEPQCLLCTERGLQTELHVCLGSFRKWARATVRSALPPRTDIVSPACQVRPTHQSISGRCWTWPTSDISFHPKSITDLRSGVEKRRSGREVQRSTFARFSGSLDFRLLQQYLPGTDLARAKKPNISSASNSWSGRDCVIAVIQISPAVTILSRIWTPLVP